MFREHGPREYQLAVHYYPELVWPVESLVRCVGLSLTVSLAGGSCSLTACTHSMHRRIMDYGVFE